MLFLADYSIWASMSEPHLIVLTCESHTVVLEVASISDSIP